MLLEDKVFAKKRVNFERLISYGFTFDGENYCYAEKILNGSFEAQVLVSKAGQVSGRVLDLDLNEEYVALRVERAMGTFVGQVREEYLAVLEKIADACFEAQLFRTDQANRLANFIATNYGDATDNPFAKFPNFTTFRHPANQKWYGLVGTVERSKLQLGDENWSPDQLKEVVEMINVKVKPERVQALIEKAGIYPAYHMSKKSWITIVFDDGLSDQELFDLVLASRQLVAPKTVSNPDGPDYWIIPANMKNYDIDRAFDVNPILDWPQKKSIKKGDFLLVYITAPTKAVRYICQILETNISDGDKQLMKIQMLERLRDDQLPLELLRELGVTNIRGARRLTAPAIAHLQKVFLK